MTKPESTSLFPPGMSGRQVQDIGDVAWNKGNTPYQPDPNSPSRGEWWGDAKINEGPYAGQTITVAGWYHTDKNGKAVVDTYYPYEMK
ncbi:hypothetical protein [Saccharopolyspora sp. CA-218241]|uniref:hypothetical protein n=1 Tax=Saccharopolyspora sp. CA-218241 TaxID=3240027 RepID=UPI003D97D541